MIWNTIKKSCQLLDRLFEKCATLLIVTGGIMVTLTVVLQVILRYLFKWPLFGLEEFSRLIAVWVYFLGAIFGTKYDSHVQGDVAARLFHTTRARAIVKTIAWSMSLLVCALFLYHSAAYSMWIYDTGERTTGLWWPRIFSVGSMVFGAFFMTVYSVVNVVKYMETAIANADWLSGGNS